MITFHYGERTANSKSGHALEALLQEMAPQLTGTVNWSGAPAHDPDALNACSYTDKYKQICELVASGVRCPEFTVDPQRVQDDREGRWLPRRRFHQQGFDLTRRRPFVADFYTKRYFWPDEWRLHLFDAPKAERYVVIRSGIKLPKSRNAHPWIKTNRLGWKISYTGGAPTNVKEEAKKAMDALDLDFGCVDVGLTESGKAYVIEVNTCPGLEGNTVRMYADRILRLLR